jgi:hypothetical protein
MAQQANVSDVRVFPTELVRVSGTTEAGRELEIDLYGPELEVFCKAIRFSMENGGVHLGHSIWHVRNGSFAPCENCLPDSRWAFLHPIPWPAAKNPGRPELC